jgi:alkylated DNA repair dioxygenase AlkB
VAVTWQPTLLDSVEPRFDPAVGGGRRRFLGDGAWLDVVPGWVTGGGALFDRVLEAAPFDASERPMYDRIVAVPRLHTGRWDHPLPELVAMAAALSARYGLELGSISANLYRNGDDSVAWHGDRIGKVRSETVVAILSLGEPRRFLLRPTGGGRSIVLDPACGDLLVMGGTCQRTWQHCVPKRAHAGSRISVMFRAGY